MSAQVQRTTAELLLGGYLDVDKAGIAKGLFNLLCVRRAGAGFEDCVGGHSYDNARRPVFGDRVIVA